MTSTRFPRPGGPPRCSVAVDLPPVADAAALAVPVVEGGEPPADLGTDAAHLAVAGFTGAAGQTLVLPGADGAPWSPSGIGDRRDRRRAPGSATSPPTSPAPCRSTRRWPSSCPTADAGISPGDFAQVVVEGVLLARWRFFVGAGGDEPTLDRADHRRSRGRRRRGPRGRRAAAQAIARAAAISRDLANCPATTLTAARMGEVALAARPGRRSRGRVLRRGAADRDGLRRHPRRQPRQRRRASADQDELPRRTSPTGHLALVGKGDHVRLRRHQPQAERRVARADEERHDRAPRRSSAR